MPGNGGDFPAEEAFFSFIEPAVCFFAGETNYQDSPSPYGIRLVDRISGKPIHVDLSEILMELGIITNRNKFILGGSGTGKSFFTNFLMLNYFLQGCHLIIVDMGNSYQGLFKWIQQKTGGKDGIYFTYTSENPISFNPFYTEDGIYDIEKAESLKTLIISLWKRNGETVTASEEVTVSNAMAAYLDSVKKGSIKPCFNTFYEFIDTQYRKVLEEKEIREKEFDIKNFLYVLEPFYKNGEYGYLLNSDKGIDLMSKRAILFEIDSIKDNKVLFPVVTMVIMEAYINKMRRLKGVRKVLLQEEAWKALAQGAMAEFIKYLYKTARKYYGEIITVTQEVDDIISSDIVKESIIMNADCKILLDQRKYLNKFDDIQQLLGLTEKEKAQILSMNLANDPNRKYKEVWLGFGGTKSAVYGTEVSMEEYLTFTTEEKEKLEVLTLAEQLGGNIELAVRELAQRKRRA